MRYITEIHLDGGALHEHIARLRWTEESATGESSRAELVRWVKDGGDARVRVGSTDVKLAVVDATSPHLRTKANGILTDNLLELPRF
ncbi:DUF3892 domain-containing protein [Corallococcus terminator]